MADKQEHFFISRIEDLIRQALFTGTSVYTDFLTTKEYMLTEKTAASFPDISVYFWGGSKDCDHFMAAFVPDEYKEFFTVDSFPICCIKVEPRHIKFTEQPLQHRDYLGAVLNLGMDRSKIGDIRISRNAAYVFCHEDFSSLIVQELISVKHSTVETTVVSQAEDIPAQEFEILNRSVASPRLDAIVAASSGCSRTRAADIIRHGNVIVNHEEKTNVSFTCPSGTVMTIYRHGKYRIVYSEEELTKKGKQKIQIFKYK